ncbi:MAG: transcriptional repressor [Proteobacteria bacterium]|nr:transcriptional repressor [Pseudomonadota bacterium]MBU1686432.1 transcriptional repressor [Pseudomonadota bacterium]
MQATRIQERLEILDLFLSIEQHVTLLELAVLVREKNPARIHDMNFLKETMEMFCQCGFARKRIFESQDPVYEHHHLGAHHDHFICTACGEIREFHNPALERLQLEIAMEHHFHPLQHKMEIYGLCTNCLEQREPKPPLLLTTVGERVKIVEITGSREVRGRLAAMGLSPGTILEVINRNPAGPVIVATNDVRIALDTSLAANIRVVHSCRHPHCLDQENHPLS